ncbi:MULTISPECIES: glycosyltransferase family 4 protein [unclassified Chryseobacterium]|uniref:glycosyltransferase family 4 protein n=1 Tax=unclassified Chryseobacterium TaxID=2593645 RepID=UPI000D70DD14|nr:MULTISPECIES: glycosyltransferase family 4 protein [unclassified Chryseobacterium]PWW29917.1 glycosyltransferase involved in cell wall biosynthesis [Chryseobacterium sp. AG844]
MSTKKILFISHEASLSGAPILVLDLIKRLKKEKENYQIDILLIRGGELYEEFAKVANNIVVAHYHLQSFSFLKRNLKRVQSIVFRKKETQQDKIDKITISLLENKYDLVYGNTMESLIWTLPFYKKNIPTIVAIHELSFGIESTYSKEFVLENISNITQIIAGSQAVADNLINKYNAAPQKVTAIHSFVDNVLNLQKDKELLKKELNIKNEELIVGIASSQELRKGTEMVPVLVQKIKQKTDLNFKFINLGGTSKSAAVRCAKLDAEKLGVEKDIIFIDHNKTPNDYINIFDVFLLMSREDPFPLVMLTAAKLKKPIVAFEKSGGAVEFLENNHGVLVPYLDIDTMAEETVKLMQDANLRESYGENIYQRLENEYSDKKLAGKIFTIIDNLL